MITRVSPAVTAGLVFGLFFFLHAAVPFSRAWPLLWPLLAGVAAVYLSMRRSTAPERFSRNVGQGAKAGAVAGLVFYLGTIPMLYLLTLPALEPLARTLAAGATVTAPGATQLLTLAAVGLLGGLVCGTIGSSIAYPLMRRLTA